MKEFKPLNSFDIEALSNFNNDLEGMLFGLDNGNVLSELNISEAEFTNLLQSFVNGQRGSLGRTVAGSWSIIPNDFDMPADARVEFIFTPTYLVTAILARTFCDYPLLVSGIDGYEDALKKGMHFCSLRSLYGHGYDWFPGAVDALTILSLGKIPLLLEKQKDLCPELYESIIKVTALMKQRLGINATDETWGQNLQSDFTSALENLYVKDDPAIYRAILSLEENGSDLIDEEDFVW